MVKEIDDMDYLNDINDQMNDRLNQLECDIGDIVFDIEEINIKKIKDNIELNIKEIKDRFELIECNIEENEDSQTNLSQTVLSNTLKLEESLSNSNKNQQNINIILLITSGVCIYLSTTR